MASSKATRGLTIGLGNSYHAFVDPYRKPGSDKIEFWNINIYRNLGGGNVQRWGGGWARTKLAASSKAWRELRRLWGMA